MDSSPAPAIVLAQLPWWVPAVAPDIEPAAAAAVGLKAETADSGSDEPMTDDETETELRHRSRHFIEGFLAGVVAALPAGSPLVGTLGGADGQQLCCPIQLVDKRKCTWERLVRSVCTFLVFYYCPKTCIKPLPTAN